MKKIINNKYAVSILLIIFILSGKNAVTGQGMANITGKVKDEALNEVLEFCNVTASSLQDSLITGTVTDSKGFFTLPVKMGSYKIIFSYIGNRPDTMLVHAYEDKFLGTIELKKDALAIDEATVKASSRISEIDRDIQVITKELKEGNSSAKYVLNKLNGVHYDEFNNSIKVDNDDRVIILVDGIQKDQEYVKNLAPDRMKKVEIIRDPAGRYGLEGYTAVINIMLDKDYMGVEIFAQERGMFDSDPQKKEYIPVQNNPSLTVTYTYDKVSVYGKYSNSSNNYNMHSYESKTYDNGLVVEMAPAFYDDASIRVKQRTNDYTLGADYFINPKHTVSYEGKLMRQPEDGNNVEVYQIANILQDGNLLYSYNNDVGVQMHSQNSYNSIFYEGKLDENNTLKSNVVYSNFTNRQEVNYTGESAGQYGQDGSDHKQNINGYLEFDHTFKDQSSLLLGYGITNENLSSEFVSDFQTNDFETKELRNKFYAYYSRSLGKKTSMKLGVAGENSDRQIEDRSDNYFIFLPHVDLKYDVSKMFNLKLKLRSEGKYPTINQTNPFTSYVDDRSVQTGNPDLNPEVTRRLSLQATFLQGALSVEPYYRFSNNMIMTTGFINQDSLFEYQFDNAGDFRNYGVKTNLTIPIGKSVFFQTSLDNYRSKVEFEDYQNEVKDWAMSGQLGYYHQKSKTVAVMGYQKNNTKQILTQGYRNQNVDFWMFLVRRPFFDEKLTVMLLYFSPIPWGVNTRQSMYIETDTYTEYEWTDMSFFKNIFMVEISYRFSKGKVIKKEKEVDYIRENEQKSLY